MGMSRRQCGVRLKLIAMVTGISSVALVAVCAFLYYSQRIEAKEELINNLTVLADVVGSNCAAALMFDDSQDANSTLSALRVNDHILFADLRTAGGETFASYRRDSLLMDYDSRAELENGAVFGKEFVIRSSDIRLDGDVVGKITLCSDLKNLDAVLKWYANTILPTIVVVLLLVFLATTWLQKGISAPILDLARVANRVTSEGDYSLRAPARSKDEIGTLVHAFNDMLDQIQARDDQLESEQKQLEARVSERTKSLRDEIAVRQEAERKHLLLAAAVEQAAESIVVTDFDGTIRYVNPAFEKKTGYSAEEALGRNPRILKSGRQDAAYYRRLWETIKSGNVWTGKFVNRRKDGTLLQEVATISPVRDAAGQIVNFVAVKRDITHELELQRQLNQAQKLEAVGSLAAGIAHEINTPIQFVGDNIRFLSDSIDDLLKLASNATAVADELSSGAQPDKVASTLRTALDAADVSYLREEIPKAIEQTLDGVNRVSTIVLAMKDFSHPEQKDKSSTDLNRAISSTLIVARNELKYVADVITDFDEDLPPVLCYPSDVNQVFLNLLVNAAHAIADVVTPGSTVRGRITVSTRRDGDSVVVAITDTGTGIPEAVRERVFEHFFTTKDVGKGTGQGLSIARAVVVEKHGGELTFETEAGKGTTFYVRLPIGEEVMEAVV